MNTIERLGVLEAKASPGPWGWTNHGEKSNNAVLGTFYAMDDECTPLFGHVTEEEYDETTGEYKRVADLDESVAYKEDNANYADFAFMAAARNALPALLAVAEAAKRLENGDTIRLRNDGYPATANAIDKLREALAALEGVKL